MNILQLHNFYNIRGGEDEVVLAEKTMLEKSKHNIYTYYVNNSHLDSFIGKFKAVFVTHSSKQSQLSIAALIKKYKIDVCHVHNFFPSITPSVFSVCQELNVPVVMTLHNYRIICPTALLLYKGNICERSLRQSAYWGVMKRVYRNSYIGSAVLAFMIEYHKKKDTWNTKVNKFICLTEFSKNKFIEAGVLADLITVKPNSCQETTFQQVSTQEPFVLYVGRISEEKGIDVLLKACENFKGKVVVIGEGKPNTKPSNVDFMGKQSKEVVLALMNQASFVVVPSICYEGFPMAIVEAFSCGTPVICSKLGSMEEIVDDNVTGLHFAPNDELDLRKKMHHLFNAPQLIKELGSNAKLKYQKLYTEEKNIKALFRIYHELLESKVE